MIIGPNDPRALGRTGRTWKGRTGKELPVMVDGDGNEYKVVTGSIADITKPSSELNLLLDALAEQLEDDIGSL